MATLKIHHPILRHPPQVTFGGGCLRTLWEDAKAHRTALMVSGSAPVQRRLSAAADRAGVDLGEVPICRKPPGEPDWPMVEVGARFLEACGPVDQVVGLGGGSVLDWCRLSLARASGALPGGRSGRLIGVPRASRLTLVPTTCGSGAEAAAIAVVRDDDGHKLPIVSPFLLADRVVLDGGFLTELTEHELARSLCDALSHGIESFLSLVPGALAKEAALSALHLILSQVDQPPSSCRRDLLMQAGFLGGLAAGHCSVGVVHAFAHSAARFGLSHRLGNALGLLPGLRINGDAPALADLLVRLGFESLDELRGSLVPVVGRALAGEDDSRAGFLADSASRALVLDAMRADVCLRTNPIRLGVNELEAFLDEVMTVERWLEGSHA